MKYLVTYEDGRSIEYKVKPRHLVEHEFETRKDGDNLIAKSYKLAWMASGSDEPFKDWLDTVDDIETLDLPDFDGSADPDGGEEPVPTSRPSRGSRRR